MALRQAVNLLIGVRIPVWELSINCLCVRIGDSGLRSLMMGFDSLQGRYE